jgi:hypothetical protein
MSAAINDIYKFVLPEKAATEVHARVISLAAGTFTTELLLNTEDHPSLQTLCKIILTRTSKALDRNSITQSVGLKIPR